MPDDVSLVNYDDDPLAEFLEVALTTIRMPLVELGIAAIGALADQIGGSSPFDLEIATTPELVVRASTAPPSDPRAARR